MVVWHNLQVLNIHKALCKQQKHGRMLKRDGVHLTPGSPGYLNCAHLVQSAVGRAKKNWYWNPTSPGHNR